MSQQLLLKSQHNSEKFSFIFILLQIWRCPPFKLIPCKTLPRDCTSYRMIYIRHVHLECPACLICADSFIPKTFNVVESTTTNDAATKETRRQRRRRLKKRKDRRGKRKGRTPREKMPRDERERVKVGHFSYYRSCL